jgi:hypothetical protein
MKHVTASLTIASCLLLVASGTAFARPQGPPTLQMPGGTPLQNTLGAPGQKGSNKGNSCPGTSGTPGNAGSAQGSPFNSTGQAGNVYAGNPGTASLANSNSGAAVAQYDRACF